MKKILGILFTIVLIVSVCVPASAANSTDSDFIIPINRSDFPINTSYMRKKPTVPVLILIIAQGQMDLLHQGLIDLKQ